MIWIRNTDGKRDSALTFKVLWNLVAVGLVGWRAYTTGVDIDLLIFAGAMAGAESVAYVVRRGQDARFPPPPTVPAPDRPPAATDPPGPVSA